MASMACDMRRVRTTTLASNIPILIDDLSYTALVCSSFLFSAQAVAVTKVVFVQMRCSGEVIPRAREYDIGMLWQECEVARRMHSGGSRKSENEKKKRLHDVNSLTLSLVHMYPHLYVCPCFRFTQVRRWSHVRDLLTCNCRLAAAQMGKLLAGGKKAAPSETCDTT